METSDTGQPEKIRVPAWTWAFVVACALIPAVSLGGLVPSLIGGLSLTACYAIGHDPQKKLATKQKLLLSIAVTVVAWGLFGGVAWIFRKGRTTHSKSSSGNSKHRVVRVKGKVVYDSRRPSEPKRPLSEVGLAERQQIYVLAQRYRSEVAEKEAEIEEREGVMTLSLESKLKKLVKKRREQLEYVCDRFRLSEDDLALLIEEGDEAEWSEVGGGEGSEED